MKREKQECNKESSAGANLISHGLIICTTQHIRPPWEDMPLVSRVNVVVVNMLTTLSGKKNKW